MTHMDLLLAEMAHKNKVIAELDARQNISKGAVTRLCNEPMIRGEIVTQDEMKQAFSEIDSKYGDSQ